VQAVVALLVVVPLCEAVAYAQAGRQVEQVAASPVTDVARAIAATDDALVGRGQDDALRTPRGQSTTHDASTKTVQ